MPDVHGDRATYDQHLGWTARKATALRRRTLDCGHPNPGEVFYHAWCDRLSCSETCANGEHECGAFAGVNSSSEEESEPVEAAPQHTVVAFPLSSASLFEPGGRVSITLPASSPVMYVVSSVDTIGAAELEPEGSASADPVADAMRSEVLRQGRTECEIDGVRQEYRDGGWTVIDETRVFTLDNSSGTFDPTRPTVRMLAEGQEIFRGPLRPFLTAALDSEADTFEANVLAALDELVQPEMSECLNDSDIPTRPWWRRIWSRTPPTLLPPSPTEGSTR